MRHPICLKVPVLVATLLLALPNAATAQTSPAPMPVSVKLPPGITVSGGGGVMTVRDADRKSVPVFGGSMEMALNRFMLAQVETSSGRWDKNSTRSGDVITMSSPSGTFTGFSGDYVISERLRQTTLVGNFLGRAGAGRLHAVFGAGFGFAFMRGENTTARVGCIATPLMPCPTSDFHSTNTYMDFVQQFVGGVDLRLTSRLTAYATFRAQLMPKVQQAALVGLRTTVRRAPVGVPYSRTKRNARLVDSTAATGKEVHVVALDHSRRTGRLVSIDDTHVTISGRDGQIAIPRKDVQGVRLVSHVFRDSTLAGLGAGMGIGFFAGLRGGGDEEGSYALEGALMFGGIGAGAGAAIGAAANLLGAGNRTVNIGPTKASLNVTPVIGKGRAGFTALISW